ncbi:putative membrane protein [Serratia marcescens]|nr:putative membrane protein [Serratia marcescens]
MLKINALVIWRCFAAVKTIISGMLARLIAPADKYKQEL